MTKPEETVNHNRPYKPGVVNRRPAARMRPAGRRLATFEESSQINFVGPIYADNIES